MWTMVVHCMVVILFLWKIWMVLGNDHLLSFSQFLNVSNIRFCGVVNRGVAIRPPNEAEFEWFFPFSFLFQFHSMNTGLQQGTMSTPGTAFSLCRPGQRSGLLNLHLPMPHKGKGVEDCFFLHLSGITQQPHSFETIRRRSYVREQSRRLVFIHLAFCIASTRHHSNHIYSFSRFSRSASRITT